MPRLARPLLPLLPLLPLAGCWHEPRPLPPLRGVTTAERPPLQRMSWQGTCGDESYGWQEAIDVTLTIRDSGDRLVASGTLAFADRRAKARLSGPRSRGDRHTLLGEMTEIDGIGTRWGLILEVEPREAAIRGRFIELLDGGGEEEMCRFAGKR
jgi:hypothetical protein